MSDADSSLDELARALEAAGAGLYMVSAEGGARRWLAGAERFGEFGESQRASEAPRDGPGIRATPRFIGVVQGGDGERAAKLFEQRRVGGRSGVQSQVTALADGLPEDALVVCVAFGLHGMREFCRAYGYDAGDALACKVGARIASLLPPESIFGRISGAKFAAVLALSAAERFQNEAERIAADIASSRFDVGFGPARAAISIGAALVRRDAAITHEPLDAALAALDEAAGEGAVAHFSRRGLAEAPNLASFDTMRAGAREVMQALEEERVPIAYQPVVNALQPDVVSFRECLARMQRLDGVLVPAGAFIPKIERLDLVGALDRRVLDLTLSTLSAHPTERLSVNVSVRTMEDPDWFMLLSDWAANDPDAPQRLIVEMTESSAVVDPDRTLAFLNQIRETGVSIALDDFGAGYSSFRHVRDFRPDWIKIDGSFVSGVAHNADNRLFVDTLVGIARNFDMATVAEFVETEEDAAVLREIGVDCLQGYLYGKPTLEPDWARDGALREGRAPSLRSSG